MGVVRAGFKTNMPETIAPVIQAPTEPSIAELHTFLGGPPAVEAAPKTEKSEAPVVEPKTETPESKTDAVVAPGPVTEENTEAATGTASTEEPEAIEEELPVGVQKKIAKEVARQSRADRAVLEAISNRKTAEDRLAKLTAGKPGSEPEQTTAPAATEAKPVRPDLDTFPGTYAEYQKALLKYDNEQEAYLIARTERTVKEQLSAQQREESLTKDWNEATEEHGADFRANMATLRDSTPEGLQMAISGLDNWSAVAVHLAKAPDELKALADKWNTNQYAAVADLGKLEARLQAGTKPPEAVKPKPAAKPLPPPPAKVGGAASTVQSVDLETADQATFNRTVQAYLRTR